MHVLARARAFGMGSGARPGALLPAMGRRALARLPVLAPAAIPAALAGSEESASTTLDDPESKTTIVSVINEAIDHMLARDARSMVFGEDVAFGGVFRATANLRDKYGAERVFNTPLCEQGIAGFAVGAAAAGWVVVAEMQFADYIFPGYDQIVNEVAKYRYRSGGTTDLGGLVFRAPCSAVGHGGHYHSQSPESQFTHTAGIKVVMPRDAYTAKGLLLASMSDRNPVIFFEPKRLYRLAVLRSSVPREAYEIPLSEAAVLCPGTDVTVVSWGAQALVAQEAAELARKEHGVSVEVIDLQTVLPWDVDTVADSVRKTGRCVVTHEAPRTSGFGAEVAATLQDKCFGYLEAPIQRACGFDTPFPLAHEPLYMPDKYRVLNSIMQTVQYDITA